MEFLEHFKTIDGIYLITSVIQILIIVYFAARLGSARRMVQTIKGDIQIQNRIAANQIAKIKEQQNDIRLYQEEIAHLTHELETSQRSLGKANMELVHFNGLFATAER